MAAPEGGITNWDMWTALGGVGAFFLTLFGTLSGVRMRQHATLQNQLKGIERGLSTKIDDIEGRLKGQIDGVAAKSDRDHEELRVQVQGLSNTIRDHYLLRRDHDQMVATVNSGMTDIRKDIGEMRNQFVESLRDLYRRPG